MRRNSQAKQQHKNALQELKAPHAGVVKDVATHTIGTVVAPGTILLSLVPIDEPLMAEVMVKNDDVGGLFAKARASNSNWRLIRFRNTAWSMAR